MTPAIEIQQLEVVAAGRRILALERLRVEAGAVVAVVGPNGAGKSTLLKVCTGFVAPSRGTVRVLGRSVNGPGTAGLAALRRQLGYVPQLLPGHSQMPLTVREVVAIGRTGIAGPFRRLSREDWRIVDEWIERLGLTSVAGRRYGDASGGEQRKATIARAMVQQPRLLMLDEPTANLDLGWREHLVGVMDELFRTAGITIVLVCHAPEVIPPCCRRVLLLQDGRLAAEGSPEEVLSSERMAGLYGRGMQVLHGAGRHAVVPRDIGAGTDAC